MTEERPAYWGQFAPQAGRQGADPDGVTVEQAVERIAALENALATGQRPEGERPSGIGGRPN